MKNNFRRIIFNKPEEISQKLLKQLVNIHIYTFESNNNKINMDKCDFNGALNTINLLREEYRKNRSLGIIKDIVYIVFTNSSYILSFSMINSEGKAMTMEWEIGIWFTIPLELRNFAKENVGKKIIISDNDW